MKIKKGQLFKSLFKRNRSMLENQSYENQPPEEQLSKDQLPKLQSEEFELIPKVDELNTFNNLVHWKNAKHLAPTWLQMVSLPAYLNLITDPRFPFGPLGLVHVSNEITLYQPLPAGATYQMLAKITEYQSHPKGMLIMATVTGKLDNQKVYESKSSFLAIISDASERKKRKSTSFEFAVEHESIQSWSLDSSIGRRYAKISGDYNLIHLNPITARLFGFKRHIAHGMYLNARALSVICADDSAGLDKSHVTNSVTGPIKMSMEFKKPVFLPAKVDLGYSINDGAIHFDLYNKTSLHASGEVTQC